MEMKAIQDIFELKENEGESKVVSLSEAIRDNVKAGMVLHIERDAGASLCEIARQFWGKSPQFTLVSQAITAHNVVLVYGGLLSRVITTNIAHMLPAPRPISLVMEAIAQNKLTAELWTPLTMQLRFMAAAWDVPFLPTKSILGSAFVEINKAGFKVMKDPFNENGRECGLVSPLAPDLSIVHGCVADRNGNTILATPYDEDLWAPRAARGGTIVTVEKIVPTSYIREHATLVKIPGYLVKSVSEAPFGAHPFARVNHSLRGFESYSADYDFATQFTDQCENPQQLKEWVKEYVLDCKDHSDYLKKLGAKRLSSLKGEAGKDAWKRNFPFHYAQVSQSETYNGVEVMVINAAREMKKIALANGYRTVLAGVGTAALAAWIAYYQLQKDNYALEVVLGSGGIGHAPRPGEPTIISASNIPTCKMLTDTLETQTVVVSGSKNQCFGAVGSAEVDRFGNLNVTQLGGKFLFGPAGALDLATGAREVVVVIAQSKERFRDKVAFVSTPGDKIKTVVSTMGVFKKLGGDAEFSLVNYIKDPSLSTAEEHVKRIQEKCGWELKVARNLSPLSQPTLEELLTLRMLDPKGIFLKRG